MPDEVIKLGRWRQKVGNDVVIIHPKTLASQVKVNNSDLESVLASMVSSTTGVVTAANGYTDSKIAEIVGGAPSTLDTLGELASALGNDADFVTTINAAIDGKADVDHDHDSSYLKLVGGTVTGEISSPTTTTYAELTTADTVNKGQLEATLSSYASTGDVCRYYVSTTQPSTLKAGDVWFEEEAQG